MDKFNEALKGKVGGHVALALAYLIYGVNLVSTKDLSQSQIFTPAALFYIRVAGAGLLFWLISIFLPKEKVSKKDMLLILPASILGLFLNQYLFLEGIVLTTPFDSGLIMTLIPIFTLIFAHFFVKEAISWQKIIGIGLSLAGVVILLLMSGTGGAGTSSIKGIILITLSIMAFSLYLGIFGPLLQRYHVVTINKWVFLYCLVYSLPFCVGDLLHTDFTGGNTPDLPVIYAELGYLVLFATFLVYFCISYGQQKLSPTVVSMYSYIQPIVAAVLGVLMGMDVITWQKILAISLVFIGVYLVNLVRKPVN